MNKAIATTDFVCSCLHPGDDERAQSRLRDGVRAQQHWEEVVALANNHLLTPALRNAFKRQGLEDELPEDLATYLEELHGLSRQRNDALRGQVLEAAGALNAIGVTPLLFKGAVHLVTDTYGDRATRIMTDIDIAVPHAMAERSMAALANLGYHESEDDDSHKENHRHLPPLVRQGDYGAMEIHTELVAENLRSVVNAQEVFGSAESVQVDGRTVLIPAPTWRVLINILHSQVIDRNHAAGLIPLRSLHEVATEQAIHGARIDWQRIQTLMAQAELGSVLSDYVYAAHRLFGMPVPGPVKISLGNRLYHARCRRQVAWHWFDRWARRLGKYSSRNIQRLYGCDDSWLSLTRARLQFALRSVARYRGR